MPLIKGKKKEFENHPRWGDGWVQSNYKGRGYPQHVSVKPTHNRTRYVVFYGPYDTMFRSKSKAIKFAINWMKKHPRG